MDERLLTRLRESGQSGDITATLEHGEAAFALSEGQLGYVDTGGAHSVALRDINRIHSDREGLLRVETAGGTAITASLLGFDPADVQGFFNEVRVATNSAKSLPQAPLPTPASSGPWKSGWSSTPGAAPVSQPPLDGGASPEPLSTPAAFEESVRVIPQPEPTPAPDAAAEPPAPTARPVVISTMPRYTPEPAPQATPKPAPTPREPKGAKEASRAVPAPTPKPSPAAKPAPAPTAPEARPVRTAPPRAFGNRELASLAEGVERLTSTLRLLAVAMGLAAILVGVLRFREADAVTGLWILGSGLVAAFALLVFAQVARLMVGMARQLSGPDQP